MPELRFVVITWVDDKREEYTPATWSSALALLRMFFETYGRAYLVAFSGDKPIEVMGWDRKEN
jgi:hypothetical protein